MAKAKTLGDLEKLMAAKLRTAMRSAVEPLLQKKVVSSAALNVVGGWSRGAGGISDLANVQADTNSVGTSVVTTVKDVAPPQESLIGTPINAHSDTMFSEWIEYGQWMDLMHFMETGEKIKREARPFIKPVEEELAANPGEIEAAIKPFFD